MCSLVEHYFYSELNILLDATTQILNLDEAVYISPRTHALGKGERLGSISSHINYE